MPGHVFLPSLLKGIVGRSPSLDFVYPTFSASGHSSVGLCPSTFSECVSAYLCAYLWRTCVLRLFIGAAAGVVWVCLGLQIWSIRLWDILYYVHTKCYIALVEISQLRYAR